MKIKITSDSTCDLSPELLKKYDIEVIPLSVILGEESRKDGVEMCADDIYAYVDQTGLLPKTSAVNIVDYMEVFQKWGKLGYTVVHFSLSSSISSTYQNACLAALEVGNVRVVDSRNLSTGQGLLVLKAAEMAQGGANADEICHKCRELTDKVDESFIINSLDYLYKGGRCSALSVFGANLMMLKPCIVVRNGIMLPEKRYRGSFDKVVLSYVKDRLHNAQEIDTRRVIIAHTQCSDETLQSVITLVKAFEPRFEEVLITTAGSTITSHCDPNTLSVVFLRK